MTPEQIAENVKRLREQDPNNEFVGTQTINALVKLVGEINMAMKNAHYELNAIRARDGAPQHIEWYGGRPLQTSSCTHEWFDSVVEGCYSSLVKSSPIAALEDA